jgi:hypothetical protein
MSAVEPPAEPSLLERALETLRGVLGTDWSVVIDNAREIGAGSRTGLDARVRIIPPGTRDKPAELLAEVREQVTPRYAESHLVPLSSSLREAQTPFIVFLVAPWISPRTQDVLREHGIGYLDLTGNAFLSSTDPAIRILTQGDRRAPRPVRPNSKNVTLGGPRAGRVVRFLVDFTPPYRPTDIAEAAGVSLPWVSRLLTQLEEQLLVRREGRDIVRVDWPELLRARAASYDLLRHNPYVGALAPRGIGEVLDRLRKLDLGAEERPRAAVTGHYAARVISPLASGGQLMLYTEAGPHPPHQLAEELGLFEVDEGAEVLLLRRHDEVVFERCRVVDGIPHVAYSQLVLDGLGGPGRMPSEAVAVLEYMSENESSWREPGKPVRLPRF